jgi:DNA-binding Xre family transcriptional regulator
MTARLDYRWHLRQVMATRGMFSTTDLLAPLSERGIKLSSSQVYRLVVDRPERLSLKILTALLDILDCSMDDLIEPVPAAGASGESRKASAAGGGSGVGELRPKRARIARRAGDRPASGICRA